MMSKILFDIKKNILKFMPVKYKCYLKEDYITSHQNIKWWENHINYIVLQQYANELKGTIADFGCNHGACTILAARNNNVENIVGFDLNKKAINIAKNLLKSSSESIVVKRKVRFVSSKLNRINYPDDYFDNGFMLHVLEHIYEKDRDNITRELKRVLKKDGFLLITVPYELAYDDGFQHVAFFDVKSLSNIMKTLGFTIIECYRDRRRDIHTPNGHDCLNILLKNIK